MLKRTLVGSITLIIFLSGMLFVREVAAATAHPPGTLVKIGSAVWRISDDGSARSGIDSLEKFLSHRFYFTNVVEANTADAALPDAGFLAWGDGVLFDYNEIIYQVSGGQRHGFISAQVFLGQGFKFAMVKKGTLESLPEGAPVRQGAEKHLPGTFLSDNQGTIWHQETTGSQPFPSAAVFFSHGGLFNEVALANPNDQLSISAASFANFRTGSLINDNGTIFVTKDTLKSSFPSAACFLEFGFSFGMAIPGQTSQLAAGPSICADSGSGGLGSGPVSDYSVQTVTTSVGTFQARVATFNLASGRIQVITDTAADRDCTASCPVADLQTYVNVNGAQSGINGTYFCPQDYPECASQSNSFFWKVIDTGLGKMINSQTGLGEQDPFLVFDASGRATYFSKWIDYKNSSFSAVAGVNSYGMIENNNISLNYTKLDDKQKTLKSIRGAIGIKGQTLYLVHVLNATIPDTALVLQGLGLDQALGLDGGGSSALMYQKSYKTLAGRNLPNAILVQEN